MKTPTLEEIKEHFKNAKEIKGIYTFKIIQINTEKYDVYLDQSGDFRQCKNEDGKEFLLWSRNEGYTEIISYKDPNDKHVQSVINKFAHRSEVGFAKYGTTLERKDLNLTEWLNHLQEELMDATLYIEKLKEEFNQLK